MQDRLADLRASREARKQAVSSSVPFVDEATGLRLYAHFNLAGAPSGTGKSTLVSNAAVPILRLGLPVTVISNEETVADVVGRIACIFHGSSFFRYRQGELSPHEVAELESLEDRLVTKVEVLDNVTCLEDAIEAFQGLASRAEKPGVVIMDYLQNVCQSRVDPNAEPWMISKRLGTFLKDYCKATPIPVLLLAQLKPKCDSSDIRSRFQNDRHIFNHAAQVLEIEADFNNRISTIRVHKDRFGDNVNRTFSFRFKYGKLEFDPSLLAQEDSDAL